MKKILRFTQSMSKPRKTLVRIQKTDPNAYQNTSSLDSALARQLAASEQRINQRTDADTLRVIREKQKLAFTDRPGYPLASGDIMSLSFNFMSDSEILRRSILEINNPASEGQKTVNDPMLGSIRDDVTCGKCKGTGRWCRGHYGHINLNFKMLHPASIVPRAIVSILTCVCNSCGGLLLNKDYIEENFGNYHGRSRLKMLEEASKGAPCTRRQGCHLNPTYLAAEAKKGKIQYTYDNKNSDNKQIIEAQVEDIEKILKSISDEDARLMGFNVPHDPNQPSAHPKKLIISKILVFPPCSRPGGEVDGEVRTDHITQIYMYIIQHNNQIKTEPSKAREHMEKVKSYYAALIDNKGGNIPVAGKGGQEHRTISHRLDGKEGLIRYNIFGKSSDFTARTPISPGPTLRPGQIGVPYEIARKLTVRKLVNNINREYLQRLMEQGDVYRYYPKDGDPKLIDENNRNNFILRDGDSVDRFIQNGDRCILLRNPVLHKQSIMGYEIVIVMGRSIQLPLLTTSPHNADFDGDEMTMHIVQDTQAEADIISIMSVEQCLIDAQSNSMSMGVVQDALLGASILTTPVSGEKPFGAIIEEQDLTRYIYIVSSKGRPHITTWEKRLQEQGVPKNTGFAVFSLLLPADLNYWQSGVRIKNGILVSGPVNKKHIGVSTDTIMQEIIKSYGPDGRTMTMQFLEDAYELLVDYMSRVGHSVTLDDCMNLDTNIREKIGEIQTMAINNIIELGPRINDPTLEFRRDNQIDAFLGESTAKIADALSEGLSENNSLMVMVKSGAKGTKGHIAGIMGGLGPQRALGKRIQPTLNGGTRCSVYSREDETDPTAHGFCTHNLLEGLTPLELVYQQMSARDDLTRMGLKSGDTGTLSMEMIKNMENLRTVPTEMVLNANEGIVSIYYGGDGFNTESLVRVKGPRGNINFWTNIYSHADQLNSKYGQDTSNVSEYINNRETYELERELMVGEDEDYEYEYED